MNDLGKFIGVFSLIIGLLLLISLTRFKETEISSNDSYDLEIIEIDEHWAYQISIGDRVVIRQMVVPAVRGKQMFESKDDAKKIGEIVLKKLQTEQLPTVTIEEIQNSNIKVNL
jgi:hypothetical protein